MRSRHHWSLGLVLSVALSSTVAAATPNKALSFHYRWADAQGVTQLSDSLSAEAMARGYDVVNAQGIVVSHVPRQLTAEERKVAQQASDEKAAKDKVIADAKAADERFLAAYPDEKDVLTMQKETLSNQDGQIHTTELNLKSQRSALGSLVANAGELDQSKRPVPKSLADRISQQQGVVAQLAALLAHQQEARAKTAEDQKVVLERYRAMAAAQKAQREAGN